ncbi:18323_t:CDS:1 [Funneliformis geosporum]|uniref:2334_t:CDS:1 n=1 Tax=Funneliformis geosporum TaxID=1117311 RepID=A0A9W4WSL4_9GLOM|nr:2334_t:CDS:1 [Funneliformis geosporum]CAI2184513.1 18323_t:CDS:1 [Funneliformis geosporum]
MKVRNIYIKDEEIIKYKLTPNAISDKNLQIILRDLRRWQQLYNKESSVTKDICEELMKKEIKKETKKKIKKLYKYLKDYNQYMEVQEVRIQLMNMLKFIKKIDRVQDDNPMFIPTTFDGDDRSCLHEVTLEFMDKVNKYIWNNKYGRKELSSKMNNQDLHQCRFISLI